MKIKEDHNLQLELNLSWLLNQEAQHKLEGRRLDWISGAWISSYTLLCDLQLHSSLKF
jgi:hypothetical protein